MFRQFSPERFLPQERIFFLKPVVFSIWVLAFSASIALFGSF
jgi:hypothetical protein